MTDQTNKPSKDGPAPALARVHDLQINDIAGLLHVEEKTRDHGPIFGSIHDLVMRALKAHNDVAKEIMGELIAEEQAIVDAAAAEKQAEADAKAKADADRIEREQAQAQPAKSAPAAPTPAPRPFVAPAPGAD